ncbi:MAG: GDP-mannose 4,6-dehydratase [Anaerolineae bacterium]|nr:GDP-mannose 4,6-dehydratase [Anaerolineae bacterium]
MATYLVTGVAGFIASKVAEFLLADGHTVVGVDNLNDAYDVRLKQWRLAQLEGKPGFEFHPTRHYEPAGIEGTVGIQGNLAIRCRHQSRGQGRRAAVGRESVGLLRDEHDRHAEPVGVVSRVQSEEVRVGFFIQPLRQRSGAALARGRRYEPPDFALCSLQEGR